jgi:hypothetical protein
LSNPVPLKRTVAQAGIALAVSLAFAAVPSAAHAAPVDLATAGPFVALGGSTVTNTGPSLLNGDLGVAPGTALVGFGLPAVVNGATHANDQAAAIAQDDLTTAYNVAAGQPVLPANDLTGTNLGNRTLTPGNYRYTSSAQLTGPLTLDAGGDPTAQFVFLISSALTTASASSVLLTNGASACNVYWQVGSSATLDTTTAFKGNLMANIDISLNNGASVDGRVLARTGEITLINNRLDNSACRSASSTTSSPTAPAATTGGVTSPATRLTPGQRTAPGAPARATPAGQGTPRGRAIIRRTRRFACTEGFRASVTGRMIKRVTFRLDGRRIASRASSPFRVDVAATPGAHKVSARVTFKDAPATKTLTLRYRVCAAALRSPRRGPSQFTG